MDECLLDPLMKKYIFKEDNMDWMELMEWEIVQDRYLLAIKTLKVWCIVRHGRKFKDCRKKLEMYHAKFIQQYITCDEEHGNFYSMSTECDLDYLGRQLLDVLKAVERTYGKKNLPKLDLKNVPWLRCENKYDNFLCEKIWNDLPVPQEMKLSPDNSILQENGEDEYQSAVPKDHLQQADETPLVSSVQQLKPEGLPPSQHQLPGGLPPGQPQQPEGLPPGQLQVPGGLHSVSSSHQQQPQGFPVASTNQQQQPEGLHSIPPDHHQHSGVLHLGPQGQHQLPGGLQYVPLGHQHKPGGPL